MLLQLQKYDLIVQYTPGKDMLIADTLSRVVAEGQHTSTDDLSDERVVYSLEATEALSEEMLKQLTEATARDSTLQLLVKTQKTGWPTHRKKLPSLNSSVLVCQKHCRCARWHIAGIR